MSVKELKPAKFSLLGKIDPFDRLIYVSSINDDATMKKLLAVTIENNDEYKIANTIFNLKYKDSRYLDYMIELLNNNLVDLSLIKEKVADDLINNTNWAFTYFLKNLDKLESNENTLCITKSFINYILNNNELYEEVLEEIIECKNIQVRDIIMYNLIKKNPDIKEDDLLRFIDNPNKVKSKLPKVCLEMSLRFEKYNNIKEIILNNYEIFFEAEYKEKMELYKLLLDKVDVKKIKEFEDLFRIYQAYENVDVDQILTALINKSDYYFLDEMIKDKEISFIASGTTTKVYRVGHKVIKFTKNKHEQNSVMKDLYLLAPTTTKYIPQDGNIMVLEIQDYLEKTHNGEEITKEDIANWNIEMEKLGYVVTDPLCSYLKPDNFGFLKDYKEANIGKFEIPEWFKKRPLVLYDIDLIYRKEDEHKKIMKFH